MSTITDRTNEALIILDEVISKMPLTREDRQVVEDCLALIKQMAQQGAAALEARISITNRHVEPALEQLSVNRAGLDNTISNRSIIGG